MEEPQDQKQVAGPLKVPRSKSYAPTPRQLEALEKARARKKAKREQMKQEGPVTSSVPLQETGMAQDLEVANEPKEVVRDHSLVKAFVEQQQVNAQPTDLGRRKRPREGDQVSFSQPEGTGWLPECPTCPSGPVEWITGIGLVGLAAVGVYTLHKNYTVSKTATSRPAMEERSKPDAPPSGGSEAKLVYQAPWE
jgi:hypothetical protein